MFQRVNDPTITLDEWIDLNTSEVPTELVEELYELYQYSDDRNEDRELHRLDNVCELCEGAGQVACANEGCDGVLIDCPTCDGEGTDPEQRDLYGFPFAHGTCWMLEKDWDRPHVLEALIASHFVVYRCEGGPFDACIVFGVDGGGYSFRGAHWIPLRLRLAHRYVSDWGNGDNGERWTEYRKLASELLKLAENEGDRPGVEKLVSDLAGAPS